MEILIAFFLVLLVKKSVDFVRYLTNGNANGAITQIVAWLFGIAATYLAEWADWTANTDAGPHILWGLAFGSAASVIHDLFTAIAKAWTTGPLLPTRTVPATPVATAAP